MIWGGESKCEHKWGESVPSAGHRSSDTFPGELQNIATQNREKRLPNYCSLCSAWRGQLGLEPTYDCGQHGRKGLMELRPNLSKDEIGYILKELIQHGLL